MVEGYLLSWVSLELTAGQIDTKILAVSLAVVSDGTDKEGTFLSFQGKPTAHP